MRQYHKIQTIYKRDPENMKHVLPGEWSLPEFEYLQHNQWTFDEKVDGTNMRVLYSGEPRTIEFRGKSDNAQVPAFLLARMRELFTPENIGRAFREAAPAVDICLYGEGFGRKIQTGGKYIPDGVDFCLFDVWVSGWWLKQEDVRDIGDRLGCVTAPSLGVGTLDDMWDLVREGITSHWGDFTAEGIIARPLVPMCTRRGDRIIAKLKYSDFDHD